MVLLRDFIEYFNGILKEKMIHKHNNANIAALSLSKILGNPIAKLVHKKKLAICGKYYNI